MVQDDLPWDAVVLLQLGGPERLDDIEPFLAELLSDPHVIRLPALVRPLQRSLGRMIARRRAPLVRPRYEQIGNGNGMASPILHHTRAQADALAKRLGIPVHVTMRCSPPRAAATAARLKEDGAQRILVLPLYPHWAGSTTGSALEDFVNAGRRAGLKARIAYVRSWATNPDYVSLVAATCLESTDQPARTHLVLSPHSLPRKYIEKGDPYCDEVEATVALLRKQLDGRFAGIHLGYQSAVGPVEWVGPTTEAQVDLVLANGADRVALCPLGFVSDHIETLYDLDRLYAPRIEAAGARAHRVKAFNDDPRFIEFLASLAHGPTTPLEA